MTEKKLDPAEKVTVRTTLQPWRDVEVTATEAEDLRRQGLLVPLKDLDMDQPESKAKGGAIRTTAEKETGR